MQGLLQRCWVLLALWLGFLCENASGQNVVGGEMTVVSGFEKPDTYHLWDFPMGMARNGSTFYAIDSINNGMQSFDIDGVGTTIFPSSAGGFADGDSASALMNGPRGMFYAESLDVFFVADANNKCVREVKFAAGWEMRTIYGGPGTNDLAWPSDVVMHTATNRMYVSNTGQHRVVMLDWHPTNPAAFFNTIGGGAQGNTDGTYPLATFHDPWGLGLDEDSNILYIADFQNDAIRWVDLDAERVYTLTSGSGHNDGDFGSALWNRPRDIHYYAPWNHIFVAEFGCSIRRIYNAAGLGSLGPVDTVLAIVRNTCGIELGTDGKCNEPSGVLFDPNSNHVLIADSRNNRIVKVPVEYTSAPSLSPTLTPTASTEAPTSEPTATPTDTPTTAPSTDAPTSEPTATPTETPTTAPSTDAPTSVPTATPTEIPAPVNACTLHVRGAILDFSGGKDSSEAKTVPPPCWKHTKYTPSTEKQEISDLAVIDNRIAELTPELCTGDCVDALQSAAQECGILGENAAFTQRIEAAMDKCRTISGGASLHGFALVWVLSLVATLFLLV